ncbi:MAG: ABC transporter permease subunit [Bacillota bacterium]
MQQMLIREFREGWRCFRFPGVLLLAVFFALMEPPSQKYMDTILRMFAEGVVLNLPKATPQAAFIKFGEDLFSMVLIAAIIVTMGIVAREKHNGLTEWFLTRPVSRNAYIFSKSVYLVITTFIVVTISSLVCALYTYTLLGPLSIIGVFYAIILLTTQMLMPLMITLSISAITGVAGAAAGAGIVSLFAMSTLGWLVSNKYTDWLPFQLKNHLPQVLTGNGPSSFWIAITLSWVIIAFLMLITKLNFSRKQI